MIRGVLGSVYEFGSIFRVLQIHPSTRRHPLKAELEEVSVSRAYANFRNRFEYRGQELYTHCRCSQQAIRRPELKG